MPMEIFSLMYEFTWIFVFIFSLLGVSITLKGENVITTYSFTTLIHAGEGWNLPQGEELRCQAQRGLPGQEGSKWIKG